MPLAMKNLFAECPLAERRVRVASFTFFDLQPLAFSRECELSGKELVDWKFVSTASVEASFYGYTVGRR
jgi:hypothetical protein